MLPTKLLTNMFLAFPFINYLFSSEYFNKISVRHIGAFTLTSLQQSVLIVLYSMSYIFIFLASLYIRIRYEETQIRNYTNVYTISLVLQEVHTVYGIFIFSSYLYMKPLLGFVNVEQLLFVHLLPTNTKMYMVYDFVWHRKRKGTPSA